MNGAELAICGSNLCGDVPFSVALRTADGRLFAQRTPPGGRVELPVLVAAACADAGLAASDVRALRLDLGPGSYTGLRVVVTFVRFLQHFGGASVQALDSLALLAARARSLPAAGASTGSPRRVRPLLDARRERFHTALYDVPANGVPPNGVPANGTLALLEPPAALPFADVLAKLAPGDVVVLPASLQAQRGAELQARGAVLHVASEVLAGELFGAGLPFAAASTAELEPRYLMATYAD